jgi:hypothetical protein
MQTKVCSKCQIEKPFTEYFKDTKRAIGIRCKCKECCKKDTYEWRSKNKSAYNNYAAQWRASNPEKQHANEIKRHYGLTSSEYQSMLAEQRYGCKICGHKHDETQKRGRLYVDHDHTTGKVRGLLCGACNSAIGYFEDNVSVMEKAITYLKGS